MTLNILEIFDLHPPFGIGVGDRLFFQDIYVKIAEATAASRNKMISVIEPLGETTDYLDTGKTGNIETIIDVQDGISFSEDDISEILFVLATLVPSISSFTTLTEITTSNAVYLEMVISLNNFVINNVLGEETLNSESIGGVYQSTLQLFIEIDCEWSDPSIGAPQSWLDLSTAAGFTV